MRLFTLLLALFLSAITVVVKAEELVVVVNANSPIQSLTKSELLNVYMGRLSYLSGNVRALPVDLPVDYDERVLFYRALVNKSPDEVNAYWARLVFSGKTLPPVQIKDMQHLYRYIKDSKDAIAYVHPAQLTQGMRVVYDFRTSHF